MIFRRQQIRTSGKNPNKTLLSQSLFTSVSSLMAARLFTRSRSTWSRLLSLRSPPLLSPLPPHTSPSHLTPLSSLLSHLHHRHFCVEADTDKEKDEYEDADKVFREIEAEAERERKEEREEKRRAAKAAGIEYKEEAESDEDEDFMGVNPLIEILERQSGKKDDEEEEQFWEPTDTESDEDDDRFTPEEIEKLEDKFERKCDRYNEYLRSFLLTEDLDEAHKLRMKIENFEEKHFKLPLEYRVIGDMMNRLKESTGKDRFVLLQKLNRALRIMQVKEAYDPNDPANFGIIQQQLVATPDDMAEQKEMVKGEGEEGEEEEGEKKGEKKEEKKEETDEDEFDEEKDEDDKFTEKINAIENKIEEKLALLDHTFGKKGRVLEQELKDLVEERNVLTEKKSRPLYRKGFDVKVINVNRTCKVTKGGQIAKYSALLATGNYHGVVGFARAKGPNAKVAIQRAYEKCFQNLHYMERYEEHTIAHAIQAQYEKTKIYLWPGPLRTGMCAGRTVETVLYLAGFSNVKSKIIGSRNPLNVIKALFKALNAIETPKDVQEKFGRTVVESYLMH